MKRQYDLYKGCNEEWWAAQPGRIVRIVCYLENELAKAKKELVRMKELEARR